MKIETDRLVLTPLGPQHAQDGYRLYRDPRVFKYLGGKAPESLEAEREKLARHEKNYWQDRGYGLMAVHRKTDGVFVGSCGYLEWEIEGVEELEIAYALLPEFWGEGYATEAARALAGYAFDTLNRHKVISLIILENTASINVALRNGMALERTWELFGKTVSVFARSRKISPSA